MSIIARRLRSLPPSEGILGRRLTWLEDDFDFIGGACSACRSTVSSVSGEYSEGDEAVDSCLRGVTLVLIVIGSASSATSGASGGAYPWPASSDW